MQQRVLLERVPQVRVCLSHLRDLLWGWVVCRNSRGGLGHDRQKLQDNISNRVVLAQAMIGRCTS